MPKVEASVEVLLDIANRVYQGQVRNLHIKRYKSGKNAGKLFAEYSLNEAAPFSDEGIQARQSVMNLLVRAAEQLSKQNSIELLVQKVSPTQEKYIHRLEVRREAR